MYTQDFELITENGKHLGPTGEFSPGQFQDMMNAELWRYSRRQLDNVLSVSGDEQFRSTILMLKIMETAMRVSFKSLTDQLHIKAPQSHLISRSSGGGSAVDGSGSGWRGGGGAGRGEGGGVSRGEVNATDGLRELNDKVESVFKLVQGQNEKVESVFKFLQAQAADVASLHAAQTQVSSSIGDLTERLEQAGVISR